jgi:hypothetical protein
MHRFGPNSMHEVMDSIARQAGRPIMLNGPVDGIVSAGGIQLAADAPPQIVLFQITGANDNGSNTWSTAPLDASYYSPGLAWTYGRRVYWTMSAGDPQVIDADPENEYLFSAASSPVNNLDSSGLPAVLPPFATGALVWCIWDEDMGGWQILSGSSSLDLQPAILDDDLYSCGSAGGHLLIENGSGSAVDCVCGNFTRGDPITVQDNLGVVAASLPAYLYGQGQFVPQGNLVYVKSIDGVNYEAVTFGQQTCQGSGSGSSGCPTNRIGAYALSDIPGYEAGQTQFLAHDESGCLKWISIGQCYGSGLSGGAIP